VIYLWLFLAFVLGLSIGLGRGSIYRHAAASWEQAALTLDEEVLALQQEIERLEAKLK
jgi:hypothetical protein